MQSESANFSYSSFLPPHLWAVSHVISHPSCHRGDGLCHQAGIVLKYRTWVEPGACRGGGCYGEQQTRFSSPTFLGRLPPLEVREAMTSSGAHVPSESGGTQEARESDAQGCGVLCCDSTLSLCRGLQFLKELQAANTRLL